ncbi:MAG: 2-oxoglutarate and iron-dependent oxygenase domain-containing protein, partial [Pseudomonadota bacterium]
MSTETFDPIAKEHQLKAESDGWDTSAPQAARPGDIPVIDLTDYFNLSDETAFKETAAELRKACEEVGFFIITGHQVDLGLIRRMFDFTRRFHALPAATKQAILMDRKEWPVGGIGYLPVKNMKLPARDKGNLNEAFIIKHDHQLNFDDNQWPDSVALPDFRETVESYALELEKLGKRLLPLFAEALEMPTNFFDEAAHKKYPHPYQLLCTSPTIYLLQTQ